MFSFIRPNVIAKGKRCYCSPQLASHLSASSVSVSTSYLSSIPSSISSSTSTSISSLYFSSSSSTSSIVYDSNDDGSSITVRSRFKEIPVHPSILQYIKRVGVG